MTRATEGRAATSRERAAASRVVDVRDERTAPELSSKYLPPAPYLDLPEPVPFRNVVGASVILLATSLGSGEFILWPFVASQVGLGLVWLASVGILTQYFLNMEIERYTLATGETAVTGFTRMWKWWAPLFMLFAILPNMWPGWATGASEALTFVFGGGNVTLITVLFLISIGIALTVSPVVYHVVEKVELVLVVGVVAFMVIAIAVATEASAWGQVFQPGFLGPIRELDDAALLLGAIAFAGMGGAGNLAQSNWIRDKGLGMGAHMPRVVSPFTGEEVSVPSTGYMFPQDEKNLRRWNAWWKLAKREQFWTFFVIGLFSIVVMSVLTFSTIGSEGDFAEGNLDFIRAEGEALKDLIGPGFGVFFWLAGTLFLLSTNVGIIDYVGRIVSDAAKVTWFRDSAFWSESKIYFAVVWGLIGLGTVILLSGMNEPVTLVTIASATGGVVMFIYSMLLIRLNRTALPEAIKVRGVRLGVLVWAVLFYGAASAYLIKENVIPLFTG